MLWTRKILSPTSGFCVALLLYLVCYCRPSSATAFPSIQCVFGKWCVGEGGKNPPSNLCTKILRCLHLPGGKRLQHNITTQTEQENIKLQTPTEGQTPPSSVEFVRIWNPSWHIKTFQSRFVSPTTQLLWFLWHYTYNIYIYIHEETIGFWFSATAYKHPPLPCHSNIEHGCVCALCVHGSCDLSERWVQSSCVN